MRRCCRKESQDDTHSRDEELPDVQGRRPDADQRDGGDEGRSRDVQDVQWDGPGACVKDVHGWWMPDVDQFMSAELKPDGTYQYSHLTMAMGFVKDRSIGVDLGAHVGTWSKPMSKLFERVVSAEPAPDTFECLQANMAKFGCQNVELRNVAMGAASGFVSMVLEGRQAELSNTGGRYVAAGGTIPVETIDSWHLPSLGFLKMDIEGSEVDAMQGAAETIKRCRPIILYENKGFWRRYGHAKMAPSELLKRLRYFQLADAGRDVIWGPK